MAKPHFDRRFFRFLRELAIENSRSWFHDNKTRYQEEVRDPLLAFISDMKAPLAKISRHYVADPRPVGGSMFRIHRDTRFSKDKTPYKTHASAHFRHEQGKSVHAPGFYVHLEPSDVFVGAGIWHPDADTLRNIRQAIVDKPKKAYEKARDHEAFRRRFELGGASLQRMPKGFEADHPMAEDLRRKDFIAVHPLSESAACSSEFLDQVVDAFRDARPFVKFLTEAVLLPW